jgi:DNA-binding NtrC family response regulator
MGAPGGEEDLRILIVDDDPLMTDMLPRRIRGALRVQVFTASTPEEGLRVADAESPEIVLSDYNLRASMTGLDLLAEIERRHPDAIRILFSGHARHEIGKSLDDAPLHGFLEKPLRLDELIAPLAAIIQETLGVDPRRVAR